VSNDLSMVMRIVRTKIDEKLEATEKALAQFADQVAADAREHAPIRKAFRGGGHSRRKGQGRVPTALEFAYMKEQAEKTSWFNEETQTMEKGYVNPNVRIITSRRVSKSSSAMDRRNVASSKYRRLGTIQMRKVPGSKSGERTITFTPRKGVRASMNVKASTQNKEGVVEPPTISDIKVGKGLTRYMNNRQKYDLLHNRGINIRSTGKGKTWEVVIGGSLRDSITASYDGLECKVTAAIDYAKYVEFGTRYMEAQPFLFPALINAHQYMAIFIASRVKG
jgi:HK97 gp10 family phage protein